jgi:hypothetical protein
MSFTKFERMCLMVAMVAVCAIPALANRVPVRQTSDNGLGTNQATWKLMGRTIQTTLTANGKAVKVTREVVCAGTQDQLDGSCVSQADGSGDYVFIYQLQSTSLNVNVNIGKLPGFVKLDGDDNSGTYGVNICDDNPDHPNDQELCTTDPNDPNYQAISGITFKAMKTSVTFLVPAFPNFAAGNTVEEGQGLTFYIVLHTKTPVPIPYPSIGIN